MTMTDRQARDLPLDAHMHTDLSPDSNVPIDAYAATALEHGIAEIAITDHVDFEPGAPAFAYSTFADRERVVRDAAERWGPQGVAIRFGVELTYDRSWEADIRAHLAGHAYDFTIGSVHDRVSSPYSPSRVAGWIAGRSLAEVVAPSFDEVTAAARSGLFDAIGHIDGVKRYVYPHIRPEAFEAAPELYEPILRALVESGTALEVNTSGLRYTIGVTFPHPAIVARFHELGGRALTIGSDAHRAEHANWGLDDGYAIATTAGFTDLTFRRGPGTDRVSVLLPVPLAHSNPDGSGSRMVRS
jgi:histidinol-phosphatase (PHP family)